MQAINIFHLTFNKTATVCPLIGDHLVCSSTTHKKSRMSFGYLLRNALASVQLDRTKLTRALSC